MRFTSLVVSVVAVGVGATGCAQTQTPSTELLSARDAYERASRGLARTLCPGRLALAQQSLDSAERALQSAPPEEARDRAYVALRQAETAEVDALTAIFSQRREHTLNALASMTGDRAAEARAQLEAIEREMSERRHLRNPDERPLASMETPPSQNGAGARRPTGASETESKAEAAARAELEGQAVRAMADLTRVAEVRREPRGIVITLSGQLLFGSGHSSLRAAAAPILEQVATALRALPPDAPPIIIEAHTDSSGSRDQDLELTERRAQAVRDYLQGRQVGNDRFAVHGLGPDRPVADDTQPQGRAENRRVEIVIPPPGLRDLPVPLPRTAREREPAPPPLALPETPAAASRPVQTSPVLDPTAQPTQL